MFGRKPRWKACEQVGRELDELRKRGVRNVFFVDDNLIGHKKAAKGLLRFLRDYQERHRYRFAFGTEASINLAQDAELLELFRAANFAWVFIGIESPDVESLRESRKVQNLHEDVLVSVRRIYAHGIDVLAGFIVGFDNDTPAVFERQFRFVVDSGIQAAMVGLLTALPHTPLHRRLEREGRLIADAETGDNTKLGTNFVPLGMEYGAMVQGYKDLHHRLLRDGEIARRIRNKLRYLRDPIYQGEYTPAERIGIVARLLAKGILPGGPRRIFHFLRSIASVAPAQIPQALVDWIAALAMRDYVRRHFVAADAGTDRAAQVTQELRAAVAAYVARGSAGLRLEGLSSALPRLSVLLSGGLDRAFFARCAHHLERLMRRTPSRLSLRIGELPESEAAHLERLLRRLARYGDRISIFAHARALGRLDIDSSVFHLVIEA